MNTTIATAPDQAASNARIAGIVLVCASVLEVFVMAHHPVGSANNIADAATEIASKAWIDRVVHGSLIALVGAVLLAYVELSYHLGLQRRMVRCAIIVYAVGVCAMIGAALIDGFIVSSLGEHYARASAADLEGFRHLLMLCELGGVQTLSNFGTLAMSSGIIFWCVALLHISNANRWLAALGLLLGALPALALLSGLLHLNMHGMLAVIVCQTLWNIVLGIQLIRAKI